MAAMPRRNWRNELAMIFQDYWEHLAVDTAPNPGHHGLWEQHYTEPSWKSSTVTSQAQVQKTCKLQGRKYILKRTCKQLPAALRVVSRRIQLYLSFDSLLESFLAEFELTNRFPGSAGEQIAHIPVVQKINKFGLCLISRFLKGVSAQDAEFRQECLQKESVLFGSIRACIPHLAQPQVERVGCNPDPSFYVPLPSTEIKTEQQLLGMVGVRSESSERFQTDPRNLVQLALRSYVFDVYWYTMGTRGYRGYEDSYGIGFPCKPRDILGTLQTPDGSGLRWFYYKDNNPDNYGWGGQTHSEWCYFVGDDLSDLLRQMRQEDVVAFARAVATC